MSFLRNKNFLFYGLIAAIITGGVIVRFWQLGTIPPGVHYDEAYNGMNALWANEAHHWKIFYPENTGREGLHINVIAFFIWLYGNNEWGLRTANAIWGSLTVIGFFFLLRQLKFSRLSQAIGTFMIATSFWHLVFSRTAYRAIMVPFVLVWMFYFLWRAVNEKRRRWLFLLVSGIFMGIGFNTYISFRIAPVIIIILLLAFIFANKKSIRNYWKYGLVFFAAIFISALPLFIFFSDHFKDFVSRSEAVSIFNAPNLTFAQAFGRSLGKHLWAFFVVGDHNPRHNYLSQPLLPAAWSVLFAIGFIISLKEIGKTVSNKIKKKERIATRLYYISVLAQSIFWIMLAPGVMSIEGIPHSLRIIGSIPGVFLLSLLPFEYVVGLYKEIEKEPGLKNKPWQENKFLTIFAGLIFMVIFGGASQIYVYFYPWASDVATFGAYERKLFDFGQLIHDLPLKDNNYIIGAFNTGISPDRKQSSLKTAEYIGYPNSQKYIFYRQMDGIGQINCNNPQLIFLESDQWLRDQYRGSCPDLKAKRFGFDNGKYSFWVMANDI